MRSRYVVEVIEEKQPVLSSPPAAQPVPSQPALTSGLPSDAPLSSSSSPSGGGSQDAGSAATSFPQTTPSAPQPQATQSHPASPQQPSRHHQYRSEPLSPQVSPEDLRAKLNAPLELPRSQPVPNQPTPAPESHQHPPDLFERLEPAVQQAWQLEQLRTAHEVPQVRLPRAPKKQRITPEIVRPSTPVASPKLERIERLYTPDHAAAQSGRAGNSRQATQKTNNRWRAPTRSPRWQRVGITLGVSLLLLAGGVGGAAAWIQHDISQAKALASTIQRNLQEGKIDLAKENVTLLERKQKRYRSAYLLARPVIAPVVGATKAKHLDALLEVSQRSLDVADQAFLTYDTATLAYAQFVGKQAGSALDTTASLSGQIEGLYTNLSGLQAEVASLDNPFEWDWIERVQEESQQSLPAVRRSLLASGQLVPVLPQVLGQSGRKQYLILLQNNAELRPTGGFIGSLGILTVEEGKFVDFRVEDVYEADGQLNGYVEPPAELKQHLGEAQWYLRDVNWSPDFPTVAEQAGWFLDKTLGIKPDGVMAINLSVAQKLLAATGPINLVDYNEVITADNLYERAQLHAEVNFFPGSSQKKDFLSAVATALFQKLMEGQGSTAKVLPALYESAQEAQFLVSVKDPSAAQVLRALGWDGEVATPDCPPPFSMGSCVVDTVMQVEANVGVNKANQFVNRDIHHTTEVTSTAAVHTRRVTVQNTSQSNAWPQGAYKAYFRLFVSPRASLTAVTIDGVNIPAEEVVQTQEVGKQSFGFLVNVPVRSSAVVEVQYSVPLDTGWTAYALFDQKQSGTGSRPGGDVLTHEIVVTDAGRVITVAPQPDVDMTLAQSPSESQRFVFESDRSKHEFMAVEVQR